MKDAVNILVLVECEQGLPSSVSLEVLGLARRLCDKLESNVVALALGNGLEKVGESLLTYGADQAYMVDAPIFTSYQADAWLPDVLNIIESNMPGVILLGHTTTGADLAPRIAFRLSTSVAMSCIDIRQQENKFAFTRPCYGGKAHEVSTFHSTQAVATIQPKTQDPISPNPKRKGPIICVKSVLDPKKVRTKIVKQVVEENNVDALVNAEIVVAGGGGMKGPEGFRLAHELASTLGGAVGASRVACDLGWCPASYQIGLSGQKVAPRIYFAIGISGTMQHIAGCSNSKVIIAINTDPDAPMFKVAKFGIIGDCHQVLTALTKAIKNIKS